MMTVPMTIIIPPEISNAFNRVECRITLMVELNERNFACSYASCFENPNFFMSTFTLSMMTCVLIVGWLRSNSVAIRPLGESESRA